MKKTILILTAILAILVSVTSCSGLFTYVQNGKGRVVIHLGDAGRTGCTSTVPNGVDTVYIEIADLNFTKDKTHDELHDLEIAWELDHPDFRDSNNPDDWPEWKKGFTISPTETVAIELTPGEWGISVGTNYETEDLHYYGAEKTVTVEAGKTVDLPIQMEYLFNTDHVDVKRRNYYDSCLSNKYVFMQKVILDDYSSDTILKYHLDTTATRYGDYEVIDDDFIYQGSYLMFNSDMGLSAAPGWFLYVYIDQFDTDGSYSHVFDRQVTVRCLTEDGVLLGYENSSTGTDYMFLFSAPGEKAIFQDTYTADNPREAAIYLKDAEGQDFHGEWDDLANAFNAAMPQQQ